jgi:hypothetical protein
MFKKERKQLFGLLKTLPSGYYTDGDRFLGNEYDLLNGSYSINDLSNDKETKFILVCENNIAYWRPYVKIKFESKNTEYKYFNTIDECNAYSVKLRKYWMHLLLVDVNKL